MLIGQLVKLQGTLGKIGRKKAGFSLYLALVPAFGMYLPNLFCAKHQRNLSLLKFFFVHYAVCTNYFFSFFVK